MAFTAVADVGLKVHGLITSFSACSFGLYLELFKFGAELFTVTASMRQIYLNFNWVRGMGIRLEW